MPAIACDHFPSVAQSALKMDISNELKRAQEKDCHQINPKMGKNLLPAT